MKTSRHAAAAAAPRAVRDRIVPYAERLFHVAYQYVRAAELRTVRTRGAGVGLVRVTVNELRGGGGGGGGANDGRVAL